MFRSTPVRSILKSTRFAPIEEPAVSQPLVPVETKRQSVSPRRVITTTITEEYRRIQRRIIEELDDGMPQAFRHVRTRASSSLEEPTEELGHDSGYSSYHDRLHTHQSLTPSVSITDQSPYESLSECYSGYSTLHNDSLRRLKAPLMSNVSSVQSTTDEAYDSELTKTPSPCSLTMDTMNTSKRYVHPELEHEFDYPSPPPPVPDRRLKPAHLRPPAPKAKPRSRQSRSQNESLHDERAGSSSASPLVAIQHLISSTSNDSSSSSSRTMSSRHYCGSIPVGNDQGMAPPYSKAEMASKKEKRNTHALDSSPMDDRNQQSSLFSRSSSTKHKSKRSSASYFDEATNGLPVRLPASPPNGHDASDKSYPTRFVQHP